MTAKKTLRGATPEAAARWLFVPVCAECGPVFAFASTGSPTWAAQAFRAHHAHQWLLPKMRKVHALERVDTYRLASKAVQRVHARELAGLSPTDT